MEQRTRRQLERFFLLTGIGCVAIWILSIAGPALYQDWGSWAFDQRLRGAPVTVSGYLTAKNDKIFARKSPPGEAQPARAVSPPAVSGPAQQMKTGSVVGRLVIPRLHLNGMVREGAGETTLALALGHIPGTALPGQSGNVGVAGHRDRLFRGLREVQTNDLLQFETTSGTYSYRVEEMQIVKPSDVGVLRPGAGPELTLVTCYPFYYVGSAPKRYIVKARQVVDESQAAVRQPAVPQQAMPQQAMRRAPAMMARASVRQAPKNWWQNGSRRSLLSRWR